MATSFAIRWNPTRRSRHRGAHALRSCRARIHPERWRRPFRWARIRRSFTAVRFTWWKSPLVNNSILVFRLLYFAIIRIFWFIYLRRMRAHWCDQSHGILRFGTFVQQVQWQEGQGAAVLVSAKSSGCYRRSWPIGMFLFLLFFFITKKIILFNWKSHFD